MNCGPCPTGFRSWSLTCVTTCCAAAATTEDLAKTLYLRSHGNQRRFSLSHGKSSHSPLRASQPRLSLEAVIVPKVTCDLPLEGAKHLKDLPHLKDLDLADPVFYMPGKIDIMLGCNVYQDLLLSEFRKGSSDEPIARETIFGWAVI